MKSIEVLKAKEVEAPLELDALVDEYALVDQRVQHLKAELKVAQQELAEARKPLDEAIEGLGPEDSILLPGIEFAVSVGKARKQVTGVNKLKLIKIIGEKRFKEVAEVAIGKIRAMLTEEEVGQVLEEDYSDARAFKVISASDT